MVPLQFAFGGIVLAIVAFVLLVTVAATVGGTYWVYRDATRRGDDDATLWTLATFGGFFFGWIPLGAGVMVLYHFVGRDRTTTANHGRVEEEWN
jgi:hypothetical protein